MTQKSKFLFFSVWMILNAALFFWLIPFAEAATPGPGAEQERFQAESKTREVKERLEDADRKSKVEFPEQTTNAAEETREELSFFVEKIHVTGNTVISGQEIRKITAPHEGKELKLSEVKAVAEEITRLYNSKGYLTCRATIPPQKIETKTIEIQVLEGKLGAVNVRGNKYSKTEKITRYVKSLGGKVVDYDTLKKYISKMNLHPDREVKAVIMPGKDLGTSDLLLDVKDAFPFHIGLDVNNFGTKLTGKERYGLSMRHTNLSGRDDILATRLQWGEQVFALSTQYVLPVGSYDTEIGASVAYTDVNVGGDFSILDIGGTAYTYSVFFNQPILDSRHVDLTWTGSFESKSIHNRLLGNPSTNDELRMFHTGINVDEIDRHGRTFIVNDFTFGADLMGASDRNDPSLSRSGSGAPFFKYTVAANRIHPVYDSTYLYMKANAQLTPEKLVSAEQMDIGGVYSVRGYPQSDYLGDAGYGGSLELRVPCYFIPRDIKVPFTQEPIWNRINFVGFFDGAYAKLKNAAVGEHTSRNYMGLGGGIRFDLPRNLTGRFEWASPMGDKPSDGSHGQFYFSISGDLI